MRRVRESVLIATAVAAVALIAAPGASATTRTVTMKQGPFVVGAYQVALQGGKFGVANPKLEGYITKMSADVVDVKTGKPVPIKRIMLHHIVFSNLGSAKAPKSQPFYGDGEERAKMDLPDGYGYPIHPTDRWGWVWMLMNHQPRADQVYIRYRMTIVTGEKRKRVIPLGWDTSHQRQALVFDVPGGGPKGSLDIRTMTRPIPVAGRLVAGLGHVHGGAKDLTLTEPSCKNRQIYRSKPTYGLPSNAFYKVRPVLHEPGPINMSQFTSKQGIPLAKGEKVRLTSRYDNQYPHTRAMGLLLAYLAPDPTVTSPCGAMPKDIRTITTKTRGRKGIPVHRIKIYDWSGTGKAIKVKGPRGSLKKVSGDTTVVADNQQFTRGNLSIPLGASVRWTFPGSVLHNVTVADGPEGFSSNRLVGGGTFSKKFTRPGTYTFFCELHPVGMIERIVVRPAR
jgi:plastocyanin